MDAEAVSVRTNLNEFRNELVYVRAAIRQSRRAAIGRARIGEGVGASGAGSLIVRRRATGERERYNSCGAEEKFSAKHFVNEVKHGRKENENRKIRSVAAPDSCLARVKDDCFPPAVHGASRTR